MADTTGGLVNFEKEIVENLVVHSNISQEIISITSDKLKLSLQEFKRNISNEGAWKAPVGIFATVLTALVSAEFKTFFGLQPETWKTIFILVMGGSIALTIKTVYSYFILKRAGKTSEDYMINQIVKDSEFRKKSKVTDNMQYGILLSKNTSKKTLREIADLLRENPGRDKIYIYIPDNPPKVIRLPYGVNYSKVVKEEVNRLISKE